MRPHVLMLFVGFAAGLAAVPAPPAQADTGLDGVVVRVEPKHSSIRLGESIDLHVTVRNEGPTATERLVVHLDVTDPTRSTSVDPEDWTSTLSKNVGAVAPGEAATVDWAIQPISGGTYATYVVAIALGVDRLASSNVVQVKVTEQHALNPGGILLAAAGTPALVGLLLLLQLRRSRRPRHRPG